MKQWFELSKEQQQGAINKAAFTVGLPEKAIEKDLWVTLVLEALFSGNYANHIVFKGGTSLSKCFDLITRFSEDIDLAVNREFLDFGGDLSNTQIRKLQKSACEFTSTELKKDLERRLAALGVPASMVEITPEAIKAEQGFQDPQRLNIKYRSLYPAVGYIAEEVRIEVMARSSTDPATDQEVTSILAKAIPEATYLNKPFIVHVVDPKRTFLEKTFLLHEEFGKDGVIRTLRMSRHVYDLYKLAARPFAEEALEDEGLYRTLVAYREKFTPVKGINYDTLLPNAINFIIPEAHSKDYENDYAQMTGEMIYGDPPAFSVLIEHLHTLTERFRAVNWIK